jgi:hypothetical protein
MDGKINLCIDTEPLQINIICVHICKIQEHVYAYIYRK